MYPRGGASPRFNCGPDIVRVVFFAQSHRPAHGSRSVDGAYLLSCRYADISSAAMNRIFHAAVLGCALALAPLQPVMASEDRCAVVGKLAVSAYLTFFAELANGRQDKATDEAGRAADVIALYGALGCDGGRLNDAIECLTQRLLDRAPSAPNLIARDCSEKAGLPQP